MNITQDHSTMTSTAVQGTATSLLALYFHRALSDSLIWLIIALIVILCDLFFGIEAAKRRGEKVRFSRAVRRTLGKICEYLCWIMLSVTLSIGFEAHWIKLTILSIVIGNELLSCLTNYFETKGKRIKLNIFKMFGKMIHIDTLEDIEVTDINIKK